MMEELLPDGAAGRNPGPIVAAEAFDDPVEAYLLPAEEATLGNVVDSRRREFTTGRHLARRALSRLGVAPTALLAGPHREPVWPPGLVGSITHCAGYRAAMVARDSTLVTVGIDAEPNEPLPDGVLEAISLADEREQVIRLLRTGYGVRWDRLLFSIKESVYKAWFPLTRRWLDFEQALVTVDPMAGSFDVRLLVPGPALPDGRTLAGFSGRWLARRGLLLSAIALPVSVLPVAPVPVAAVPVTAVPAPLCPSQPSAT